MDAADAADAAEASDSGSAPAESPAARVYRRYVALGDSSTEGLEDPDGHGGYRGWADRLAEHVARAQGTLLYANLGVRGKSTRQIRDEQFEAALAMEPDLVTLFAGTNDAVGRHFDTRSVSGDLAQMHARAVAAGATVLSFTLPDLTPVMPLGRFVAERIATLNEILRDMASTHGTLLVDFARDPRASDPRIWSPDGFHVNALGHAGMAQALASALGLAVEDVWGRELTPHRPPSRLRRAAKDLAWGVQYLVPWVWRHARGRSSGDHRQPKRPGLVRVEAHALPGPPD